MAFIHRSEWYIPAPIKVTTFNNNTALLAALISITFNIPPAEALTILNQWIAAFTQLLTSTGLIALFEFWYIDAH